MEPSAGPVFLNKNSASISGASAVVTLPRGVAAFESKLDQACSRQASDVGVWNYTTRRGNAHRTENCKVVYLWHPWAGCTVQIHQVIDKVAGAVARCSHDDCATGRLLELPLWMFDQSTCAPMRVETHPHVNITALRALRALLDATTIGDAEVGRIPSNTPVCGAAKASRKPNRGKAHATTTAGSTRPPKRNTAAQSIHYGERQQRNTNAGMADASRANTQGANDNAARAHLSLAKDAPVGRVVQSVGHVTSRPVLGGLHHQYSRI